MVLENGLTVLLLERGDLPIVSVQALYRVGSRNERPGQTGAAHFVECIRRVRELAPATRIEILVPDFRGRLERALDILEAAPQRGKLSVLAGVREFPVRVKCASLAWHTMKAALDRQTETSTE